MTTSSPHRAKGPTAAEAAQTDAPAGGETAVQEEGASAAIPQEMDAPEPEPDDTHAKEDAHAAGDRPRDVAPNAATESAAGDAPAEAPAPPPFTPMSPLRSAGYLLTAAVLALSQSFSQSVVSVNATQLQGAFGATQYETMWLVAAYMAPNVSLTLALIKIRAQYGLRNFAELSIVGFLLAALLNYAAGDLWSNVAVRFVSGMAAAPMTSLAFLYALEPLPPHRKLNVGLAFALTLIFIGAPLTRLLSPHLLEIGSWHGLTALEASLAAMAFGLIYLLPLAPQPRAKVIHPADVISFTLIFIGFGCAAVCFTLGTSYWWTEYAWIGWTLATGIACLAASVTMELNRESPLIDVRWILSPEILHFAGVLLLFRLFLTEQTSGVAGLMRVTGIQNDQTLMLWAIILAATVLGGVICALTLKPGRDPYFHAVALALVIVGTLMDSRVTTNFIPSQFYLSQAMIGLASALFLPPAMLKGFMAALMKGRQYILSFIIVFLVTQKIGALLGSAVYQTFVRIRTQVHLQDLYAAMPRTDPLVTQSLGQLTRLYAPTVADTTQRSAQAVRQLATQASQQASIMAYADAFKLTAVLAAITLSLLLGHLALDAWRAHRAAAAQPDAPKTQPA